VFRVYNKKKDIKEIEYELYVIKHLIKEKLKIPLLISDVNNKHIIAFEDRFAVLMSYVEGSHIPWLPISQKLAKNIAVEVFKLKIALETIKLKRKKYMWSKFPISNFNYELISEKKNMLEQLGNLDYSKFKKSVIHSDLSRENLLIKDHEVVAILDFDDVTYDYYVIELANVITQIFISGEKGVDWPALNVFWDNLKKRIFLNRSEIEALIPFMLHRNFIVLSVCEQKDNYFKDISTSVINKIKYILKDRKKICSVLK
jgi:Ser/Thr protein kinase RdoA (MazF antagonist)